MPRTVNVRCLVGVVASTLHISEFMILMLKVLTMVGLMSFISAPTPAFAAQRGCETDGAPLMNGVTRQAIARSIDVHSGARRSSMQTILDVGARIGPRQRVKPVTPVLVKALPQYAGYGYILANKDIVIVHRPTRRIAYVLPFCP